MAREFFGAAKIFAEKVFGPNAGMFWEIKGLDLEAVERSANEEVRTVCDLCIGYLPQEGVFDVLQSFPGSSTSVAFSVDRLGRVQTFFDDLPNPDETGLVTIDGTGTFRITHCGPGEEEEYATRYVNALAEAVRRCATRGLSGGPDSWSR